MEELPSRRSPKGRQARAAILHDTLDAFATRVKDAAVGAAEPYGTALDDTEFAVMRAVATSDISRMGELAAAAGVPASTATEAVDRLVAKGLVERDRDSEDRRVVVVTLSDEGRELFDALVGARRAVCAKALARMSDEEQAALLTALKRLGGVAAAFGPLQRHR